MRNGPHTPSDAAARARALDVGGSFLVQAPAGSGKTELLTDRILALLATVERPEEIVAITFTRKAAAEMHERVLEKLARAQQADASGAAADETVQRRRSDALAQRVLARDAELGWNLLAHPARLGVRTIDAFCAALVRRMPWLSELGGMPAVADDAKAHYEHAAQATLAMADAVPAVRALLAHLDVDWRAARDALAQMLAARDQWLPLLAHGDDRAGLETALQAALQQQLQALAAVMPDGWQAALAEPLRAATAALDAAADAETLHNPNNPYNPLAALRDWEGAIGADAANLPRWRALAQVLLTGQGSLRSPRGVNARLGFGPKTAHKAALVAWLEAQQTEAAPSPLDWRARLAALATTPEPVISDAQWQILGAQLTTLKLAAAQLTVRFAQTGEVDFIDIAQRAARALGSSDAPGDLLLALDAGIRHILIDEFQDTSQTQIDLLRVLTSGWQPGDGRTLFLVGDPMQSVYRFRKAEVGLFLQVRDAGLGAGSQTLKPEFLQLTENFRSQAGLVGWVNRVFGALLPARDDAASGAIRYAPSVAHHPSLAGEAVTLHTVWAGPEADAQTQAIAVRLAREALAAGQSVAVLVRARRHVGGLTQALARAGVAHRAVDLVPLASRQVVVDLVQLARALAHPGDRMAWLALARAPWCGLTLASLTHLFGTDHETPVPQLLARALQPGGVAERLAPDERTRLARVAAILCDAPPADLPFAAQLERLWQRLGGPLIYPDVGDAADVQSLLRLFERIAPYGALDTARLDAELQRLYAIAPEGVETQASAAAPAVQIMTMHKAKGLQFDVVILYGLHRKPRHAETPLVRFEHDAGRVLMAPIKPRADAEADPLSAYLAAREAARETFEAERLLYVAATRARHRLHGIGVVAVDPKTGGVRAPAATTLLGRLWPHIPEPVPLGVPVAGEVNPDADADTAPQPGALLRRVVLAAFAEVAAEAETAAEADAQATAQTDAPATALPDAVGATAPAAFQLLRPDAWDDLTGTVAHAWLARLGSDGPDAWPPARLAASLPNIRRQLARAGVPDAHLAVCAAVVLETLSATLASPRGRWLLGLAQARREWPLVDSAGQVAVIDLAVSDEAGWLVVDYKTTRPHADELPAAFAQRLRARYQAQLARYCRHVTQLDGRPARAALYCPRAEVWLEFDDFS